MITIVVLQCVLFFKQMCVVGPLLNIMQFSTPPPNLTSIINSKTPKRICTIFGSQNLNAASFAGIVYKPPEYQEHDFNEAPKFTTALNDRAATVGYTTKLLCSVRGSPKVRRVLILSFTNVKKVSFIFFSCLNICLVFYDSLSS